MKNTYTSNNSGDLPTAPLSRRKFITMTGAGLAVLSFPMSSAFAFEGKKQLASPKIVWLLLRGALDS